MFENSRTLVRARPVASINPPRKMESPGRGLFLGVLLLCSVTFGRSQESPAEKEAKVPEDFPRFVVPGHEREMRSLRELYWLHYQPAGPLIPLWDEWMPMSTLWPAIGSGNDLESMRGKWAAALSSRPMNAEGYVLTLQHDGPAHAEGWPFPGWPMSGGVGWHFRGTGVPGYDVPTSGPENWNITGGTLGDVNDKGLIVELTEPRATLSHAG